MLSLPAIIPAPPSNALELGPLTIRYYGMAIAIGVLVAVTILRRRYAALGGDPDLADRVALWGVGFGFLGARLGYVLPRLDRYLPERPWGILAVWEGGLALYGGLTLGLVTVIVLLRRWHGDLPAFLDAVAPAVPVAQAIGRLGNYFNQELFGTPLDPSVPWALEVDPPFRGEFPDAATFHPTFLYEALWNLALAAVIVRLGRRGSLRRGALAFVYMVGYGGVRFLLELIRTDQRAFELGLTANGWMSVAVITTGVAGLIVLHRRPARIEPGRVEPGPVEPGPVEERSGPS